MARALIRVGDSTSHGGSVTEASMTMRSEDGRGFARVGDKVSCPIKGHGTNAIATGDPTFILDGRPVAREGDTTACGATLIASQHVTTVSNESDQAMPRQGTANNGIVASHVASNQQPWSNDEDQSDTFDRLFQVIDQDGVPVSGITVTLATPDGQTAKVQTDAEGTTPPVSGNNGEQAGLVLFRGAE